MKKWTGFLLLLALACDLTGCGRTETGSELLTETKKAVIPIEETVEPAVEETVEGIALHIYCGDEQAENIVQDTIYVEEVTEQIVMEQLVKALNMDTDRKSVV